MSKYCSRCGCYIPDNMTGCLACGTVHAVEGTTPRIREATIPQSAPLTAPFAQGSQGGRGDPAPTTRKPIPRRYACQAHITSEGDFYGGRYRYIIRCGGEKRIYQLTFADVERGISEAELLDRVCEGCTRRVE